MRSARACALFLLGLLATLLGGCFLYASLSDFSDGPVASSDAGSDATSSDDGGHDSSSSSDGAVDVDAGPPATTECGPVRCRLDRGEVCCFDGNGKGPVRCDQSAKCVTDAGARLIESTCDELSDCAAKPGTVCCHGCAECNTPTPAVCVVPTNCSNQYDVIACDPSVPQSCPDAGKCIPVTSSLYDGRCQF